MSIDIFYIKQSLRRLEIYGIIRAITADFRDNLALAYK